MFLWISERTLNIFRLIFMLPYIPPSLFIITMSELPEAPEELSENLETKVIAQLTVYSSQKDPKGKVKESKSQKTKELVFTFLDDKYIEFLQMLLAKHSQDKYKVTERWPFLCTHLYPCQDQPVHLFNVLSSLCASLPNISISGSITKSTIWFI